MGAMAASELPVQSKPPVQREAQATEGGTPGTQVSSEEVELKGLPTWYFPIAGLFAGIFDIAHAYPVLYAVIPVLAVVQAVLALTVLKARFRLMKALWKNKRTRLLALGLLVVRFAIRYGLGVAGLALGAATGQVAVGLLMAVIAAAMAWGDQWLILRTLRRARGAAA
ncbi:hypothetical protein ABT160_20235 [Streptomyces sp. NPDC001941]|uniref:hypothetical protein n=1 Tax=Streptomyces sp. NPDC001941 TaxID=3154659 RepID=UPI00331DEFDE